MLFSFAILAITALILAWVFEKLNLPGLLGMILAGVLLGPFSQTQCQDFLAKRLPDQLLSFVNESVFIHPIWLEASEQLRLAALIVILFRAGLGIEKKTLKQVGMPAMWMSSVPSLLEGLTVLCLAHIWLGLTWIEAGVLGFILAAVSPAVVVPSMLQIKEQKLGQAKGVPTLILAAASIDDVFAITLFGAFISLLPTTHADTSGISTSSESTQALSHVIFEIAGIPISTLTGIGLGLLVGYLCVRFFNCVAIRHTKKILLLMILAIFLVQLQEADFFPFASLLAIMAIGFVLLERSPQIAEKLSAKFNKLWIFAELILFTLIGAAVDLSVIGQTGLLGLAVILIGLCARSLGVCLSLVGSSLNAKERLFCVISYLPKATVQAAIGGIALSLVQSGDVVLSNGEQTGSLILAIAVLSIVITAPLGAIGIKQSAPVLLELEPESELKPSPINQPNSTPSK